MAALQKIRNRGVLLVSLIALALFLFVVGDALRGGESIWNQSRQQVGEIDGESVSIQDYQKIYEDFQLYYEIAQSKSSFSEEESNRIKDEAWQNYVTNKLISTQCEKLGIAVTDEEVSEVIKSGYSQFLQVPVFMNEQTGRYDYAQLAAFLAQYQQAKQSGNQLPDIYEKIYKFYLFAQKEIRNQLLIQKYQVLLGQSIRSNSQLAKSEFEGRINSSEILVAAVPATTVENSEVEVTDEEVKARYNQNKAKYEQYIETRDIKVLDVTVVASSEDKTALEADFKGYEEDLAKASNATELANAVRKSTSAVSYADVLKTKDAFPAFISTSLDSAAVGVVAKTAYDPASNAYYTYKLVERTTLADSVLYRQLGVIGKDEADIQTKADSIVNAIAAGAAFKDLAKKYNQTGDSAWISTSMFENSNMDPDNQLFINTLYAMANGQTKALKLDNGNTVILQVLDKKNAVTKYNVASIVKELKFSDATYNKEYNKFSSFVAANTNLEQIEANAVKEGYVVRPIEDVTSGNHTIAGIRNTRDALKWVFDEAEPGDISQLYECGNNDHLLLVALTGVNKSGYRALDKLSTEIKDELMQEKKLDKIAAQLADVKTIEAAAKVKGAIVDTVKHVTFNAPAFISATRSSEPVISAVAAKTAKGTVSAPVKGNAGVFVLKVLNQTKSDEPFNAQVEQQQLNSQAYRVVSSSLINTLYLNAKVVDNRYKFF